MMSDEDRERLEQALREWEEETLKKALARAAGVIGCGCQLSR